MAGLVVAGTVGSVVVLLAPAMEMFLPSAVRSRHFGLSVLALAAAYAACRAVVKRRSRTSSSKGQLDWAVDRLDDLGAMALRGWLTAGVAVVCLGLLATWLPHYLTWPWGRDADTFATIAQSWDVGIRPYRDIRGYNFPGAIYTLWILGKLAGWGRTWPLFAMDAAALMVLGAVLAAWSRRCFGRALPGLMAYLVYLVFYLDRDYERVAQRDWHACLAVVLGLMVLQAWPGRAGRIVSAWLAAAALAIRPHTVLFLPAMAAALIEGMELRRKQAPESSFQRVAHPDAGARPGVGLIQALAEWSLALGLFTLSAFAPLLIVGIAGDSVRSLMVVVYGGAYPHASPATAMQIFIEELGSPTTLVVIGLLSLVLVVSQGEWRRRTATWLLALSGALLYRLFHPYQHFYLIYPVVLVSSVALALPLGWIAARERIAAPLRVAALLLVISEMIPRLPNYCSLSDSLTALRALAQGQTLPPAPPPGSLTWFDPRRDPRYTWDDYRRTLLHIRHTTGPTTLVANVLKEAPYPALNGPTARLSPFRAESGICWMLHVDMDLDDEFANELEHAVDSVVVWAPEELNERSRLSLPRLTEVIRQHYRFENRFGRIEVWRRVTGHR
jgi:hypothetical protein